MTRTTTGRCVVVQGEDAARFLLAELLADHPGGAPHRTRRCLEIPRTSEDARAITRFVGPQRIYTPLEIETRLTGARPAGSMLAVLPTALKDHVQLPNSVFEHEYA